MAYLLRSLLLLMMIFFLTTYLGAMGLVSLPVHHVSMAIPMYLFLLFTQSFVMFYFIGVGRLLNNLEEAIHVAREQKDPVSLGLDLSPDTDLKPYETKIHKWAFEAKLSKRQIIPWTMLSILLGMFAFLMGAAHDTRLVSKTVHAGLVYGTLVVTLIGFVRQWQNLGRNHRLLRQTKSLFGLSDFSM